MQLIRPQIPSTEKQYVVWRCQSAYCTHKSEERSACVRYCLRAYEVNQSFSVCMHMYSTIAALHVQWLGTHRIHCNHNDLAPDFMRFYLFLARREGGNAAKNANPTAIQTVCYGRISFGNHIMAIFVAKVSHCIGFIRCGVFWVKCHTHYSLIWHTISIWKIHNANGKWQTNCRSAM